MTTVRKQHEREFEVDAEGNYSVMWGKKEIPLSAFYREPARFIDWELKYWHAMDCTRDLVIHVSRDNERYILGKVSA